jgi:Primase C terminal 2 (PriCT-2)
VSGVGTYDKNDAKALYQWMADNDTVEGDDGWMRAGMAAKAEFGDAGLALWEILATKGGLTDESLNRWRSYAFDCSPRHRKGSAAGTLPL